MLNTCTAVAKSPTTAYQLLKRLANGLAIQFEAEAAASVRKDTSKQRAKKAAGHSRAVRAASVARASQRGLITLLIELSKRRGRGRPGRRPTRPFFDSGDF